MAWCCCRSSATGRYPSCAMPSTESSSCSPRHTTSAISRRSFCGKVWNCGSSPARRERKMPLMQSGIFVSGAGSALRYQLFEVGDDLVRLEHQHVTFQCVEYDLGGIADQRAGEPGAGHGADYR